MVLHNIFKNKYISQRRESNPWLTVYDTVTLPTELLWHIPLLGPKRIKMSEAPLYYGELSYPGKSLLSIGVFISIIHFKSKVEIRLRRFINNTVCIIGFYNQNISHFRNYLFSVNNSIPIGIQEIEYFCLYFVSMWFSCFIRLNLYFLHQTSWISHICSIKKDFFTVSCIILPRFRCSWDKLHKVYSEIS